MENTLVHEAEYGAPFRLGQFRLTVRKIKGRGNRAKVVIESNGAISVGPESEGARPIAVIKPLEGR